MKTIIKLMVLLAVIQFSFSGIAQHHSASGFMQYSLVQSFEVNSQMPDISPFGFDVGANFRTGPSSPLFLGLSFGYQNYGNERSDWDDIKTTHNIYNFGLNLRINVFGSEDVKVYAKGDLGFNFLNTRSFIGSNGFGTFGKNLVLALLASEDDQVEYYEVNVIHSFNSNTPNLGLGLGLEFPLDFDNDFIFMEVGYRYFGKTELIEKDNVHIGADFIDYFITETNLSLTNLKIGLSHYF